MIARINLGRRVKWRDPVKQDACYFGLELWRLFIGFVITLEPKDTSQ